MREGGRLTLGARLDAGGGTGSEAAVLDVADEGVGIPPEELDAIFQPFRGTFDKGTGLGLAIVHRIVSDYGGEIQVSSTVGRGTTVSVRLPVRAVAAA
jgi:signal transduction histidine kinase